MAEIASSEVDRVKKALNFDERQAEPAANGKVKCIPLSREYLYKRQFRLRDFSIVLNRLKPQSQYLVDPSTANENCRVVLKDLRHHPKWRPVVERILKSQGQIPHEPAEELAPKPTEAFPGQPAFSSTPTKLFKQAPEQVKPRAEPVYPVPEDARLTPTPGKKKPLDLIEMQKRLEEGCYDSVLDFHLDITKVRSSARIGGPAKKSILAKFDETYRASMKEFCPWFDFGNPAASFDPKTPADNVSAPPTSDHRYSATTFNNSLHQKASEQNLVSLMRRKYQQEKDLRLCLLCGNVGDGDHNGPGRLLYFRQNEWVHLK